MADSITPEEIRTTFAELAQECREYRKELLTRTKNKECLKAIKEAMEVDEKIPDLVDSIYHLTFIRKRALTEPNFDFCDIEVDSIKLQHLFEETLNLLKGFVNLIEMGEDRNKITKWLSENIGEIK